MTHLLTSAEPTPADRHPTTHSGHLLKLAVLAALSTLGACGGGEKYQSYNADSPFFGADETTDNAATFNNPALLDPRVNYTDEIIEIDDPGAGIDSFSAGVEKSLEPGADGQSAVIQAVASIELTLVAEIDPPVVDGDPLQATSIDGGWGDWGVVSYNMRGPERKGAIDWISHFSSSSPRLRSQVIFDDADVNAVSVLGTAVYAASATDDPAVPFPAVLDRVPLRNDRFTLVSYRRVPLVSFAATSVFRTGNLLYVTSGSAGELSAFSSWTLSERGAYPLHDARWVARDAAGNRIVVAQGTPGQLSVFEEGEFPGGSMNLINTFPFPGADVPESKTTVEIEGEHAFVAAGTEGVQILCLDDGEVVASVPRPDPAALNLDPSVVVTNAVAVDDDLMFISNGEAGVYVATSEQDFRDYDCNESPEITMLGQLQFGDLESVNHVVFERGYLFVAAGLGGVKIVEVEAERQRGRR